MKLSKLQNIIGIFIILSHLVIIGLILWFFISLKEFEDLTTTLGIIVPMFSVYTTTIVLFITRQKYVVKPEDKKDKYVTKIYAFISFLYPAMLVLFVVIMLILRYKMILSPFETFKKLIGLAEILFGVYIGYIINSLYEVKLKST